MKRLTVCAATAVALLLCPGRAWAQTIEEITINPSSPVQLMPFQVRVSGVTSAEEVAPAVPPVAYSRTANDLMVDFRFHLPDGAVRPSNPPYAASYVVEPLPAGNYQLHLRTLLNGNPVDAAFVSFTVIPEPATITAVLAATFLLARRRRMTPA